MAQQVSVYTGGITSPQSTNIEQKITRKKQLYLLFWIDETEPTVDTTWDPRGHLTGRDFFKEAAQTRLINLKTEIWYDANFHHVHCPPINHFGEIQKIINNWINKYGGLDKVEMKEVSFFSHGGSDGPIIYNASSFDSNDILLDDNFRVQMKPNLWANINFYWATNKQCRLNFFGCNTANKKGGVSRIFAKNISRFINSPNVTTSGQTTYSFPSFYPDTRYTSALRSTNKGWNVGPTYMVGGNSGEGKKALLGKVKVNKMSFYKDNIYSGDLYQSIFNDHRKPRTSRHSVELKMIKAWQVNF